MSKMVQRVSISTGTEALPQKGATGDLILACKHHSMLAAGVLDFSSPTPWLKAVQGWHSSPDSPKLVDLPCPTCCRRLMKRCLISCRLSCWFASLRVRATAVPAALEELFQPGLPLSGWYSAQGRHAALGRRSPANPATTRHCKVSHVCMVHNAAAHSSYPCHLAMLSMYGSQTCITSLIAAR